jgi:hypothetical protein
LASLAYWASKLAHARRTSWSQDARVSSSCRLYWICHQLISLVGPHVETGDESLCVTGRQLDVWCLRYFGPNTEASLRVGWYLRHVGYTFVARLHPTMFWSNSRSSRLAGVSCSWSDVIAPIALLPRDLTCVLLAMSTRLADLSTIFAYPGLYRSTSFRFAEFLNVSCVLQLGFSAPMR